MRRIIVQLIEKAGVFKTNRPDSLALGRGRVMTVPVEVKLLEALKERLKRNNHHYPQRKPEEF